jgi:hypothetical protein
VDPVLLRRVYVLFVMEIQARTVVTDRMLVTGPRHRHAVLAEYAGLDNQHRPHRARDLRPPNSDGIAMAEIADLTTAKIRRRRVLGGLINEYEWVAWPPPSTATPQVKDHDRVMEPRRCGVTDRAMCRRHLG